MPNSGKSSSFSTYTSMMRVTKTGRPYAKDMFDLYSAMVIQLRLTDHRQFFRTYPSTFTTDEAVACLSDLKFTHIVRTPDPADPSRHLATRTTTTFSMSPSMAKTLGTHFINARLVENAVDPQTRTMKDKGIWQPTPKGKYMVQEFSQRAHVSISHLQQPLSRVESFKIFSFDRLKDDDKLAFSRPNMTNAFKTMLAWLPTEKLLADDVGGLKDRALQEYKYTFYGYQCFEWISEYTTVTTREEAELIAAEFVLYGWIAQILDKSDRANSSKDESVTFKMTRNTLYYVTERGQKALGWDELEQVADDKASVTSSKSNSSSYDKSELVQQQKAHANRLLPTEEHINPGGLVSASVTEQRQVLPHAEDTQHKEHNAKLHFGFVAADGSTPQETSHGDSPPSINAGDADLDDVTQKLLRMRASGSNNTTNNKRRNSATSSPVADERPRERTASGSSTLDSDHSGRPSSINEREGHPPMDIVGTISGDQHKDSQWRRLRQILEDPLVRMYFRDFMKANFCEENINFWVDYYNLRKKSYNGRTHQNDLLSDAYAIYDNYLSANARSEVNIDHALRQEIIRLVEATFSVVAGTATDLPFAANTAVQTQTAVVVTGAGGPTLRSMLSLYDRVNDHICRIMAQDTVPRFVKTQKFKDLLAKNPAIRDSLEHQQVTPPSSSPSISSSGVDD